MDKKLLEALRKLLALNAEVLPDSTTPEQFSKFVEEQAGKLLIKPEDVKNLQRIISEKDQKIKELSENKGDNKQEQPDKLDILQKQIDSLTQAITASNSEKKFEKLKEQFPDISPRLLMTLNDEELEKVVAEQREIAKSHYKGAEIFSTPHYSSLEDFDKELESVKSNPEISAMEKATKIMALNRAKNNFQPV